ncbi:MAG: hypothetical protein JWO05_3298 [Gemmatimonadetes bacterium]|nr:hypothetical protein [Gemmatimonadota bacterium]
MGTGNANTGATEGERPAPRRGQNLMKNKEAPAQARGLLRIDWTVSCDGATSERLSMYGASARDIYSGMLR